MEGVTGDGAANTLDNLKKNNNYKMETECPICLSELNGTLTTMGCCKKVFHLECILGCLKEKLKCPMCRADHASLKMANDNIVLVTPKVVNYSGALAMLCVFGVAIYSSIFT